MKTPNLEVAKTRAMQRFAEIMILQKNNMVIRGKTVEQGIKDFILRYWHLIIKKMKLIYQNQKKYLSLKINRKKLNLKNQKLFHYLIKS